MKTLYRKLHIHSQLVLFVFFFKGDFFFLVILFIYFWLCWVFVAAWAFLWL